MAEALAMTTEETRRRGKKLRRDTSMLMGVWIGEGEGSTDDDGEQRDHNGEDLHDAHRV